MTTGKALQDYPEIHFEIKEFAGGVMVTFAQKQPELPNEGVSGGVNEGVSEGVSEGVNSLIQLVLREPGLRSRALAEMLQTSPKNVERWLKQLKHSGQIEFRGATKTGGYYQKLP